MEVSLRMHHHRPLPSPSAECPSPLPLPPPQVSWRMPDGWRKMFKGHACYDPDKVLGGGRSGSTGREDQVHQHQEARLLPPRQGAGREEEGAETREGGEGWRQ